VPELQNDFTRLSDAVEAAKAQIESLKALTTAYSTKREAALTKIEAQCLLVKRQTVLFLDARLLDKKGLSAHQRSMAARVLCSLAAELVDTPYFDGLQEVLTRHELPNPNAQIEQDDYAKYDFDALFEKIDQQQNAAAARRAAAQAARQAAKQATKQAAKRTASAQKTPQEMEAAATAAALQANREQTIKAIYRKLSSALHPDKERDPVVREQKNSLMVEANKAYAAQDLDGLLRLQKEAMRYGHSGTALGDAQLALINGMLHQQLVDVRAKAEAMQQRIRAAFGLPYNAVVTTLALDKLLKKEVEAMLGEAAYLSGQFARMQIDNGFLKLWLREMD
jgi:pyruvate/2-oxoglutarate dehydrogenase complex dihydrolipoamide acyltransferase (E2) component